MCAIIIIRMTLITDYISPRSVIWISVKGDQIDREGWSVYLKYTPHEQAAMERTIQDTRIVDRTVFDFFLIIFISFINFSFQVITLLYKIYTEALWILYIFYCHIFTFLSIYTLFYYHSPVAFLYFYIIFCHFCIIFSIIT